MSVYSNREINASIYLCLRNATNLTIHSFPLNSCLVQFTLTVTVTDVFGIFDVRCASPSFSLFLFHTPSIFGVRVFFFFQFNLMLFFFSSFFPSFFVKFSCRLCRPVYISRSVTIAHSMLHSTENEIFSSRNNKHKRTHTSHTTYNADSI